MALYGQFYVIYGILIMFNYLFYIIWFNSNHLWVIILFNFKYWHNFLTLYRLRLHFNCILNFYYYLWIFIIIIIYYNLLYIYVWGWSFTRMIRGGSKNT